MLFVLNRYRHAAQLVGNRDSVLELGCGEGLGTALLLQTCSRYTGIDFDEEALSFAKTNHPESSWVQDNFLGKNYGLHDFVLSLDVIEHIAQAREIRYLQTLWNNTSPDGVCVVGTPNIASETHASPPSREGHINLFNGPRLKALLERAYKNVFLFSMNDEVLHTGFEPMAHYLMALACNKREAIASV